MRSLQKLIAFGSTWAFLACACGFGSELRFRRGTWSSEKEVSGNSTGKEVSGDSAGKEASGDSTGKEASGDSTGKEVSGDSTGSRSVRRILPADETSGNTVQGSGKKGSAGQSPPESGPSASGRVPSRGGKEKPEIKEGESGGAAGGTGKSSPVVTPQGAAASGKTPGKKEPSKVVESGSSGETSPASEKKGEAAAAASGEETGKPGEAGGGEAGGGRIKPAGEEEPQQEAGKEEEAEGEEKKKGSLKVIEPGDESLVGKPGQISKGEIKVALFLEFIAGYKGVPVIYDSVGASTYFEKTINVQFDTKATYEIVKEILEINGFEVIERDLSDGSTIIEVQARKVADTRAEPTPIVDIEADLGKLGLSPDEMVTVVIPLKYVESSEVEDLLNDVFPRARSKTRGSEVELVEIERTNTLIMKVQCSLVEYVRELIKKIDVELPEAEQIIEIIEVREAAVSELVGLLEEVLTGSSEMRAEGSASQSRTSSARRRTSTSSRLRRSSLSGSYESDTILISEPRTQKIIVISTSQYELQLVRSLVEELDTPVTNVRRRTHIYQVKYLTAVNVADVLSALIEGRSLRTGLSGRTSGTRQSSTTRSKTRTTSTRRSSSRRSSSLSEEYTNIVPHEETNSLLIQADPEEYEEIVHILDSIDRKRNQVFLETALVQVAEKSDLNFTIELLAGNLDDRDLRAAAMSSLGLSTLDPTQLPGTFDRMILENAPATGLIGLVSNKGRLPAMVRFFKQDNQSQVVATPFILADDNEQNQIDIRKTTYIKTTTQLTNESTITEPKGEDAGVTLRITPTISKKSVLLDMFLEVSEFAQSATITGNLPDKSINSIEGKVTVPDGELFVVGGLTNSTVAQSVDKIPLLGDIPILGFLFQSKSTSRQRSNLYAFLTAHVLTDEKFRDIGDLTRQAEEELKGYKQGKDIEIQNFNTPPEYESKEKGPGRHDFTPVDPYREREGD